MRSFRFVHAADLYLDSPFQGIQEIDTDIADELKEATFKAFTNIVNLCIDREVDFLLIAGDVFDGAERSLRAQIRFRDGLGRLGESGIPTYSVYGNHDPLDSWVTGLVWPEQVHFFGADAVERVCCQGEGEDLASLYGISYARRDVGDNLALGYQSHDDDSFAIGLLHTNVGGAPGHEAYAPCSLEDLRTAGMDYWALGHIHKWEILQETEPAVVYAGNPQGRHPEEKGARGCMFVEVEEGGFPRVEFVPMDTVRWVSDEVTIDELDNEDELLEGLENRCLELQDREDGRSIICRLQLIGRGHLHRRLRQRRVDEFTDAVRESLAGKQPFIWLDRIEDRTRGSIDVEARARGEDFVGDFLRITQQCREDPEKLEILRERLSDLYGHRVGRKHLRFPDNERLRELLEEAQTRCLDLMVEEED